FIAFQRGVILVLRTAASPLAPVVDLAVWAVSAAWIRRRNAAMVIGVALNWAIAARMAAYMILARPMAPGALSLVVPSDARGCEGDSDVPMMFLLPLGRGSAAQPPRPRPFQGRVPVDPGFPSPIW